MAIVLALMFAALFLGPLTMLSACQAYAYREITKVVPSPWAQPDEPQAELSPAIGAPTGRMARALVGVPLVGVAALLAFRAYRRLWRDR